MANLQSSNFYIPSWFFKLMIGIFIYLSWGALYFIYWGILLGSILFPSFKKIAKRIGKTSSLILIFFSFLGIASLFLFAIIPIFLNSVDTLLPSLKASIDALSADSFDFLVSSSVIRSNILSFIKDSSSFLFSIQNIVDSLFSILNTASEILSDSLLIIFATLGMLAYQENIISSFSRYLPIQTHQNLALSFDNFIIHLTAYLKSIFYSACLIFVSMWIFFLSIQLESSFEWAILSSILSFIPYLGFLIQLALTSFIFWIYHYSLFWIIVGILYQAILYFLIGFYVQPKLIGKSVSIHNFIIILLMIVGGKIGGFVGLLFSIPIFLMIRSFFASDIKKMLRFIREI